MAITQWRPRSRAVRAVWCTGSKFYVDLFGLIAISGGGNRVFLTETEESFLLVIRESGIQPGQQFEIMDGDWVTLTDEGVYEVIHDLDFRTRYEPAV